MNLRIERTNSLMNNKMLVLSKRRVIYLFHEFKSCKVGIGVMQIGNTSSTTFFNNRLLWVHRDYTFIVFRILWFVFQIEIKREVKNVE